MSIDSKMAAGEVADCAPDGRAAMAQWADNAQGRWILPAWVKSPRTIVDEASAGLHAAFASVNAASHRHDDPKLPPNRTRAL